MSGTINHPLNRRERNLVDLLVQMHAEFGLAANFTSEAVAHINGPSAGSLAALVMHGYAQQVREGGQIGYRLTEKGFALHAGIEVPL